MAYNPAMYYGNSYGQGTMGNMGGMGYQSGAGMYGQMPQQGMMSYAPAQGQNQMGIIWVDGEVGAKAYQMPAGWPVNTPMPLWDTNDTIIYLKSTNQMGMPNPLQRIHYRMEENGQRTQDVALLESGTGGNAAGEHRPDMSEYVRKDDLEAMKEELKNAIQSMQSQTGTAAEAAKGARSSAKSAV